ncbi:argininosuccinate lyase [Gemmatimonas sp.]|uniref:argininosuccinate lyase n=1 Tax=Gemmatimonas sp. TaxID=1962908 RepID=UPI0025C2617C|nr:argininosuccinate lyase [Gemmatimonas sp.]MCA2985256.1 argininosuccinate lyase [Gemmatimonas sp.]
MSNDTGTHKLWGGRFAGGPSPLLDAINRSIGTDFRLWPHDIRLSRAWALALSKAGVFTAEEAEQLRAGLDRVAMRIADGAPPIATDEDIHTMIDRLLHEEAGTVASKLHTGRSRNDQVATASRLWTMDACRKLDAAIRELQQALLTQAESIADAILPAYTHLQRAQPVSGAHWLLSHFWPLERDRVRLANALRNAAVLPLGSGAIAGSAFPVPRDVLRDELEFASISPNSIDATGDRDFVAETLFVCTMTAVHCSRIAEDLIVYGSSEFGFVKFGDGFSTGSSMMPQKRNPDVFELARGSGARVLGDLVSLVGTIKGLPSGYSKDLQDDKRALFNAVDLLHLVLPAMAGAISELRFERARMRAAVSSAMMATDLADYLVKKGATFREAHGAVGSLVRQAEEAGIEMTELPVDAFSKANPLFGDDARDALGAEASLAARNIAGGTGPEAVRAQIAQAHAALSTPAL